MPEFTSTILEGRERALPSAGYIGDGGAQKKAPGTVPGAENCQRGGGEDASQNGAALTLFLLYSGYNIALLKILNFLCQFVYLFFQIHPALRACGRWHAGDLARLHKVVKGAGGDAQLLPCEDGQDHPR